MTRANTSEDANAGRQSLAKALAAVSTRQFLPHGEDFGLRNQSLTDRQ
jgi:hypothetical protein